MTNNRNIGNFIAESDGLVDEISPLLHGHTPEVLGSAIAELLAIFIAGHHPEIRDVTFNTLIDLAKSLVPVHIERLVEEGMAPEDWREPTKQ